MKKQKQFIVCDCCQFETEVKGDSLSVTAPQEGWSHLIHTDEGGMVLKSDLCSNCSTAMYTVKTKLMEFAYQAHLMTRDPKGTKLSEAGKAAFNELIEKYQPPLMPTQREIESLRQLRAELTPYLLTKHGLDLSKAIAWLEKTL